MMQVAITKADGKPGHVPLDPRAPVYAITVSDQDGTPTDAVRLRAAYVSHFATCPKASEFSGGKIKG
jgi:hypothetical protein